LQENGKTNYCICGKDSNTPFTITSVIIKFGLGIDVILLLQSVPIEVLEHYNMTSMTLEYRRECTQSNIVESMTSPTERVFESNNNSKNRKPDLQYTHLLRLQHDKADVVRARTEWNFKQNQQ